MEVVAERFYRGFRFLECQCTCGGGNFFAAAEDVEAGLVKSCGYQNAGSDVKRLFGRRFPMPPESPPRPPIFRQLWLNPKWQDAPYHPNWSTERPNRTPMLPFK